MFASVFYSTHTPVLNVVDAEGTCWAACDASPGIVRIPANATCDQDVEWITLPYQ